jgi:hypothetical protein
MMRRFAPVAALAASLATPAAAADRVASFGVLWINTSLEPTRPDEEARLAAVQRQLEEGLIGRGWSLVDTTSVADRAAGMDLRSCTVCELNFARELDADMALLAWVQKVSNLILNINLQVHDVATGRLVGAGSVDIRGNTDESWSRGMRRLIERQIPQSPATP